MEEEKHSKKGEQIDVCTLGYEVETNGFHGGDSGHGGYLTIMFTNRGSVDMEITGDTLPYHEPVGMGKSFMIEMRGDAEIRTMTAALKRISTFLEKVLGPSE